MVAVGAADQVELLDGAPQLVEGDVVGEVARARTGSRRTSWRHTSSRNSVRACCLDRVVDDLREVLVGPVAAREADQAEARRQQAAVGEVVDRRHDLLAGQVAGDAEDHHAARAGDPRQPPVLRIAQRIGLGHRVAFPPVVADQRPRRGVLRGERVVVAGHRRRDLLGQLLAELHAPLVEAVDAPDDALGERDVLVERDQLAEHGRAQLGRHDRRRRTVAGEHPRRHERLVGALGPHLVGGLAERQRLRLGEEVGQEQLVHVRALPILGGIDERVGGARDRDEVGRHQPRALVDQLVEGVLPVGAGLAPPHLAGARGDRAAVRAHALAVRLHRQLLEVRREPVQQLGVRQDRVGLGVEEVRVPDVQQTHQRRDVPAELGGAEVLVHGVHARQQVGEALRADGDHERRADRRVERVAAADPVPEAEGVVGIDPEVGHLVEGGGDGDEVPGDGLGAVARRTGRRAARPCTGGRW